MNEINSVYAFIINSGYLIYIIAIIIIIAVFLLSRKITKIIVRAFLRLAGKSKSKIDDQIVSAYRKPLRILIIILGVFISMRIMPLFYDNKAVWMVVVKSFRSSLVLLTAWGIYNLEDVKRLLAAIIMKKADMQVNTILIPFLSKSLRVITVILAFLIVAQEWNFSVSSLLAGLGLGGLAFALAAKDMLANIFGGIVILLDKPFGIGDWIKSGDIEGIVEDINFRSVKVRTFAQSLVSLPNSELVNNPITNVSRMEKRRVTFSIYLKLGTTVEQIKECKEKIKLILKENDDVDDEQIVVALDDIAESSLNLLVYYFTKSTQWMEYVKIKEEVYFKILGIINEENVEFSNTLQGFLARRSESK